MTAQEIIAEMEKMSSEEREKVAEGLQKIAFPEMKNPTLDLPDVLREFTGVVDGWPEDMSDNHDHYLYGTPKRRP